MDNLKLKTLSKEIKLPSNIEAEQALLGSVLVNNDIIDEVSNIITVKDFYDPLHSKIYSLIENLHNKGMIANPITLKNSFEKDESLSEIGGTEYLVKLTRYLHSDVNRGEKYEFLCYKPAKNGNKGKEGILPAHLPELKGDVVTFIGSSFMKMGEEEPYLNHCISLNTCDNVDGSVIESYANESDVLLKWRDLIRKEKPHIIIGYNIFGFDWKFLFERSEELGCKDEFLRISKINDHLCKPVNKTIKIASGEHNLQYPDIPGIVQLDLYNYFRRQFNFESYKLDNVSKELIGDGVKAVKVCDGLTKIESSNLTGLKVGHYICLEEIQHCTDLYKEGKKMSSFH